MPYLCQKCNLYCEDIDETPCDKKPCTDFNPMEVEFIHWIRKVDGENRIACSDSEIVLNRSLLFSNHMAGVTCPRCHLVASQTPSTKPPPILFSFQEIGGAAAQDWSAIEWDELGLYPELLTKLQELSQSKDVQNAREWLKQHPNPEETFGDELDILAASLSLEKT